MPSVKNVATVAFNALLICGACAAVTVTTPNYTVPGHVIAGDATRRSVRSRAQFAYASPITGNRTLRVTFQLVDDSAFPAPVGIYLDGGTAKANETVSVDVTQAFVKSTPAGVTVDADIVPYDRLDPSRVYKFKVLSVWDVTDAIHADLSESGTQATGNSYIHFANTAAASLRVSALMQTGAYSQTFRVSSADAAAPESAFKITPTVKLYRYDPGAATASVSLRVSVVLRDDLNAVIPLATSTFDRSVADVLAKALFADDPYSKTSALGDLEIRPTGQLDAVNRTYTATVTVAFMDVPGSETYISVYNGAATGAATLLDFNGELRFNTIQTTFTDISNTPSAGGISGTRRSTTLTLAAGTGRIVGQGDAYTFGGGPLNVALATNGIAYLLAGSPTVNVTGPASDTDSLKGIGFERANLQLSTSGLAAGTMSVTLPPGVSCTTNANTMRFGSTLSTTNVGLTQALDPSGVVSLPAGRLTEESKPVEYAVSGIDWTGSTGQMTAAVTSVTPVRLAEVESLEADSAKLINPSAAKKAANDHLYLGANNVSGGTLTIARDGNGNGTVTAQLTLGGYKFHPHLPYAAPTDLSQDINYGGGTITIAADKIVPAASSMTGVGAFLVPYNRACADRGDVSPACDNAPDTGLMQFTPDGAVLRVTRDGGLQANGQARESDGGAVGPLYLMWGQNPGDITKYAHTITTSFDEGAYLMAGSSLPGGVAATASTAPEASSSAWLGAGAILYSGVDRAGVADDNVARPGTAAYVESDAHIADYPGINFRTTDFGTANASSILAGGAPAAYALTARSQYYTRNAGVSGIHEAADFDRLLQLYGAAPVGYPVKFTTFKFSYLDNFNEDSRTDGSITLPEPSDFTVDFSRLTLTCPGGLNEAQVDSSVPLLLKYWGDAPITPLSLRFHTADGCSPAGPAVLVMGVQAECELFDKLLSGELGFRGSGQIAARADPQVAANGVPPFDSRLKVPSVGLPGPASKTYTFTPSQDAYFNAADADGAADTGYLNLAGTVDVPFFEDLKWHVQSGADYTEGLVPGLYEVAGGWESAGDTFFSNIFFDAENKGFGGASAEAYRQSLRDGGTYAVTARQDWLGITDAFHYDLQWNQGGRAFSSEDVTKDFFVVSLSHRAKYLCPDTAELTFGLSYDGLPQVNLSGLADSALDSGVGYTQNLIDAMGDVAAGALLGGLDAGKTLLSNEIEDLMAPVIDGPVMSEVDTLLDSLYGGAPGEPAAEISVANATAAVNSAIRNPGAVRAAINTAFTTVGDVNGTGTAVGVVNSSLTDIRGGVEKLTASNGLFQTAGIKKLVSSLVAREAPQFVSLVAGELAGAALDDVVNTPALDEIRSSLGGVNTLLAEIGDKVVNPTTGLKAQLNAKMSAEIVSLSDSIADAVDEELARFASAGNIDMAEVPRAELRARIRSIIADRLVSSETAGALQTQVRQYVQDAVTACTTQIDSGMQQVNGTLRDVIATRLAEVDQSINGSILGPMSDMLGTGRLSGYAHITGDSLTLLRVDGRFRFKVPDDLDLSAYLQIKQLTSDNAGGCVPAGQTANEVLIGAERVPLEWISPNLKANVGVKFTLMDGDPIGLGGFFDMTGGPLTFEAFTINDMNAALAFGAIDGDPWAAENYLAASADLQIESWGMAGGVFFGRSCSLDPIALIDPEVAGVLGNPPFTGAYLYGEARLPVNELIGIPSSCMLHIGIGAGNGVFYFAEGPTFGGKLVGEVSGEALCLVSISGRMSLVGSKQGLDLTGPMRFAGKGTLKGKAGACPFCVRFKKSVGIKFNVSGGDISSPDISY
ncbi:MAG: hypothetical protein FGM15_07455 [Chthoniobacterales bacterium]|nr:hypothetical protein [Chthoniobacterales bacterium]